MRRRDVLAGVGSLGVLAGAGTLAVYGIPSGGDPDDSRAEPRHDPIEIETVEATGSEAGSQLVPADGEVTFVDLFATTCDICKDQMPALGDAADRVGGEVTFISITNERESQVTDAELAEWWDEYDGRWTVGRDPTSELVVHYGTSTPIAVLFDSEGRVQWEESGRKTSDEIVSKIEEVLESDAGVESDAGG